MRAVEQASIHSQNAFPATRWSLVTLLHRDEARASEALRVLCSAYWQPVYAFLRRSGFDLHDAEDTTQSFFAHMIEKQTFGRADRERGKLRTFLLTDLKGFLANERRAAGRLKRGGAVEFVPMDVEGAEQRLERELADGMSPDKAFDRAWVMTLLQRVFDDLERLYAGEGKAALFAELKPFVIEGSEPGEPYAAIAARVGMSEGTLRVNMHRLRARYRELLMREVADTLDSPVSALAELQSLLRAAG